MAAPGPPVAKLQCTASLAGARPAGFTSVPGRATVAFGAADPSPGSTAPVYPWSVGKGPPRQDHLAAARAPASVPYKARARSGTRLVAGPRPNPMACPMRTLSVKKQGEVPLSPQGGSGGIPRPFEGGIGGPGGHRGEVGIPPAPLAGGASLQKKRHLAKSRKPFCAHWSHPLKKPRSHRNAQRRNFRFRSLQVLRQAWPRRFPKGDRKALWSRPQARNPLRSQKRYSKIPCQQSERPCPRNQGHGLSHYFPCHRMKLVATFGFSGGSSPCLRARSMHLISQAMFLPRLVMVCKPSASCAASAGVLPWMLFQ